MTTFIFILYTISTIIVGEGKLRKSEFGDNFMNLLKDGTIKVVR